jgi:hypothetical protein
MEDPRWVNLWLWVLFLVMGLVCVECVLEFADRDQVAREVESGRLTLNAAVDDDDARTNAIFDGIVSLIVGSRMMPEVESRDYRWMVSSRSVREEFFWICSHVIFYITF